MDSSGCVVGFGAIFLRPLRYLLDVETNIQIIPIEESATELPLETVYVHLRVAIQPPVLERDQLLEDFQSSHLTCSDLSDDIQAEAQSNSPLKYTQDCKVRCLDEAEEKTLNSLRGTYIWLLIRMQPSSEQNTFGILAAREKALHVQYQILASSESFCFPLDHSNIIKLLVTDELIDNVDTKMLQFTFLNISSSRSKALESDLKSISTSTADSIALAASEAAAAEEVQRRQRVEVELAEAKSIAQFKDRECLEAQLQSKRDVQRALDLEHARHEQECARTLLEQKLAEREHQNEELKQARKQLEDQLLATTIDSTKRFQVSVASNDQALEMLKQRAISDANEREDLMRRLRVLEEEKLALQVKSRACFIQ